MLIPKPEMLKYLTKAKLWNAVKDYSQNCQLHMLLHITTKLHMKLKLGNFYGWCVVVAATWCFLLWEGRMKEKCIIEQEELDWGLWEKWKWGWSRRDCGTVVFTIGGKDIVPKDTVVNIDKNNKITHFVDYIPVNMWRWVSFLNPPMYHFNLVEQLWAHIFFQMPNCNI